MPQHEKLLQTAIRVWVSRCVTCPHKFAAHDRSEARTPQQHMWEANRGVVAGWPDTELCLPDGRTIRVELKDTGKHVKAGSNQERVGNELRELGHVCEQANSVHRYWAILAANNVPMVRTAELAATDADLKLSARREQTAVSKPEPKKARSRPTFAQVRRGNQFALAMGKAPQ